MENKEANDLIVSISNMVEVNKETKNSKGIKRKYVDDFNDAIKQVIKEDIVIPTEEEVVSPKDDEVDVPKEEEIVTPKEEEEVVTSNEDKNIALNDEAILSLNDNEILDTKKEKVKELNFVDLLKQYITNKTLMNDIEVKLDERTKTCLMFILHTYPHELNGIHKLVELVIADGKINIDDLPVIIKFCGTVYKLVKKTNMDYKTSIEFSSLILKFIIRVLLAEKKLNIDIADILLFIECFDSLVDECFDILKQNEVIEKKCTFFFKKFLCKK